MCEQGRAQQRHLIWRSDELESTELFVYDGTGEQRLLTGRVITSRHGAPMLINYRVTVDRNWSAKMAAIDIDSLHSSSSITIEGTDGGWQVNGITEKGLASCSDIDLGWTPATNTIPIRRLDLRPGTSREIRAVWVRFPQLEVVAARQTYQRLDRETWIYRSGEFSATLVTDELGIVRDYGNSLWRTEAVAGEGHQFAASD